MFSSTLLQRFEDEDWGRYPGLLGHYVATIAAHQPGELPKSSLHLNCHTELSHLVIASPCPATTGAPTGSGSHRPGRIGPRVRRAPLLPVRSSKVDMDLLLIIRHHWVRLQLCIYRETLVYVAFVDTVTKVWLIKCIFHGKPQLSI